MPDGSSAFSAPVLFDSTVITTAPVSLRLISSRAPATYSSMSFTFRMDTGRAELRLEADRMGDIFPALKKELQTEKTASGLAFKDASVYLNGESCRKKSARLKDGDEIVAIMARLPEWERPANATMKSKVYGKQRVFVRRKGNE